MPRAKKLMPKLQEKMLSKNNGPSELLNHRQLLPITPTINNLLVLDQSEQTRRLFRKMDDTQQKELVTLIVILYFPTFINQNTNNQLYRDNQVKTS